VLKVFVRVVDRFYLERARAEGIEGPKTGMLSFQQRFGGSLNRHPHIHAIAIDGVYALDPRTGEVRFHFTRAPDHADIERVAAMVATRVTRMLTQRSGAGAATLLAPIDLLCALGAVDLALLPGGRARLSFALHRQARTRRRHPEPARDRQDTRPSSATAAARRAFASGRSLLHRPAGARRLSELERAR
jgi:hypothetical protein